MLLKTVVFLVTISEFSVWGLECYQCESLKEKGCQPLDTTLQRAKVCEAPTADLCVVHRAPSVGGEIHAERSCANSTDGHPCKGVVDDDHYCYSCKTDGCNASSNSEKNDIYKLWGDFSGFVVVELALQLLVYYVCEST